MKEPKEIKIYRQNFRSIYKDQSLRLICDNYLRNIESMTHHHGVAHTITYHKELLRFISQRAMNQEATFDHKFMWTQTRGGIPSFLVKGLKLPFHVLMEDIRFKQGLLTICSYVKSMKSPISYDVSTITRENPMSKTSRYVELIEDITSHFDTFVKARGVKPFELNSSHDPIFATPKASAMGPNAIGETSILDAIAVTETGIFSTIDSLAKLVFTKEAYNQWSKIFSDSLSLRNPDSVHTYVTGRLHFLQEGGGKTRVICIPDIWTQTVLKPIHEYLMKGVLKKLPCDGTFSHPRLAKRVRKYTKTNPLFCYDLRAATDRMPVDLQQKIMETLLGKELGTLWKVLLTDREISYPDGTLRYAVGQPMGMLSSWAAMAITHHAIINYCKNDRSFYAVIGDDMAIASKRGAEKYEKVLSELGMEISHEKSIKSNERNNLGEIAKRLFIDGCEISPIPPDILIKSTGTLVGFLEFIRVFSEKFHHSDPGGFSDSEYSTVLEHLFTNSKLKDDYHTHVLLTCPALEYFPILPSIPPLSGMRTAWRTDIPNVLKRLRSDLDSFILNEANQRTNAKVYALAYDPEAFGESTKLRKSPLYQAYKSSVKAELLKLVRKIDAIYIDEEADAFATDPIQDLKNILSFPSPLRGQMDQIYLSKREIRIRNTNGLIQQFYSKNPFYRNPEFKLVDKTSVIPKKF